MGNHERERHEQLNLFNPALFSVKAIANILRPRFPNHFGEAEHDTFIDDLAGLPPESYEASILQFPSLTDLPPETA